MLELHQVGTSFAQEDSESQTQTGTHRGHHHHRSHRRRHHGTHRAKMDHFKLWKTPKEAALALVLAAEKKVGWDIDKYLILTVMAGLYVGIGGSVSVTIASYFYESSPGVAKLLFGLTFPVALALILLVGGELFTGNTMIFSFGLFQRNVTVLSACFSWFASFFGNWAGCVLYAWLFGVVAGCFSSPEATAYIQAIAELKTSLGWGQALLRGIPANFLVCASVFVAVAAEDIVSKYTAIYTMISAFVFAGYEHCIANQFLISAGIFMGADVTYGEFIYRNLIPVAIGNFIGGGIFVGVLSWYLYSCTEDPVAFPTSPTPISFNWKKWSFIKAYQMWRGKRAESQTPV